MPATPEQHLMRWLESHGISADDAELVTQTNRVRTYSVPPFKHGALMVVGVKVTPGGSDQITRAVEDALTARATLRASDTVPAAQGALQTLIDRCTVVIVADPRSGVDSPNDAARRAALAGFAEAGLITITRSGSTAVYTPSPLLLKREGV